MWLHWPSRFIASRLSTLQATASSHLPHSSLSVVFCLLNQVSPVHKRVPLCFALGPASLGAGPHEERLSLPVLDATSLLEAWIKKNSLFAKGMCLCKTYSSAHCCIGRKITASANPQSLLTAFPCSPSLP